MDLNGDGRLDIITGSISGKIHWFRRKPNGTFAEGVTLVDKGNKPIEPGRSSAVAAADWDGDGDTDVIVGNGEGVVFLLLNEGTKTKPAFGRLESLKADGRAINAGNSASPFVADWDRDGKQDLLLGASSGKVVWFRNVGEAGKPQLAAPVTLVEAIPGDFSSQAGAFRNPKRSAFNSRVCAVDWNGDGRLDLLVGDYAGWEESGGWKLHGWVWVYPRKTELAEK